MYYDYRSSKYYKRRVKVISGAALLLLVGTIAVFYSADKNAAQVQEDSTSLGDFNKKLYPGYATFYSDFGFSGDQLKMDMYTYNYANLPAIGWNDKISSFKIGEGVRVKICANSGCEGDWDSVVEIVGPYNQGDFNENNDVATEVYLYPYNAQNEKYV